MKITCYHKGLDRSLVKIKNHNNHKEFHREITVEIVATASNKI